MKKVLAHTAFPAAFLPLPLLLLLLLLLLLFLLLLPAAPAKAVNLKEGDKLTLDLDGSVKGYGFAMHLLYPWNLIQLLGWDSRSAVMGMGDVRLKHKGRYKDRVTWEIHIRSALLLGSAPNMLDTMGGGVGALAEPPRSLPLQFTDMDDPKILWKTELDRLLVKVRFWKIDLTVGRQPISFGVGFIWQPADLVGTFSPIEIDREYKPGVDAIRADIALGRFTELSVVGVAGGPPCRHSGAGLNPHRWVTPEGDGCSPKAARFDLDHSSAAVRYRTSISKFDVGGIAGFVRGDLVVGAFTAGAIKRFRLRAEVTFTHDFTGDDLDTYYWTPVNDFFRAVVGFDYAFKTKRALSTLVEIYYNGWGTWDKDAYLRRMQLARLAEFAEVTNVGVLYAAWGWRYEAADRLNLSFTAMSNLCDPSFHLSMTMDFTLSDSSSVVFGAFVPLGKGVRINPHPVSLQDIIVAGSEFGIYPYMAFVEFKKYF